MNLVQQLFPNLKNKKEIRNAESNLQQYLSSVLDIFEQSSIKHKPPIKDQPGAVKNIIKK